MNCANAENLICDYADLESAERRELECHLAECQACAELARDSAAALAFIGSAPAIEPPPELITRILADAPWKTPRPKPRAWRWLAELGGAFLEPKFAMGMAMTVLSVSMLTRFAPVRQLRPADVRPAEVWAGIEDRAVRTWTRSAKFYDNVAVVSEIQTMIEDWQQQGSDTQPDTAPAGERQAPAQSEPAESR